MCGRVRIKHCAASGMQTHTHTRETAQKYKQTCVFVCVFTRTCQHSKSLRVKHLINQRRQRRRQRGRLCCAARVRVSSHTRPAQFAPVYNAHTHTHTHNVWFTESDRHARQRLTKSQNTISIMRSLRTRASIIRRDDRYTHVRAHTHTMQTKMSRAAIGRSGKCWWWSTPRAPEQNACNFPAVLSVRKALCCTRAPYTHTAHDE